MSICPHGKQRRVECDHCFLESAKGQAMVNMWLGKRPPKRKSWQVGFYESDDPYVLTSRELQARFFVTKLLLMPKSLVFVSASTDDKPWKDDLGRPLDEAFFRQWKSPDMILEDHASSVNELRLRDNAVYVVVEKGSCVNLRVRWDGEPQGKRHAVLIGFCEESSE